LKLRYRRNQIRILWHKALYRVLLLRKRLLEPLYINRVRLSLLNAERELIAKHGCDWRLCLFDDQVVKFLEVRDNIHKRAWWPNAGTERRGRPSASALATGVARPSSLQGSG